MKYLKQRAQVFVSECWQAGFDTAAIPHYLTPDCKHRTETGKCVGSSSFANSMRDWYGAFPTSTTHICSTHGYNNLVISYVSFQGVHLNQYAILSNSEFDYSLSAKHPDGKQYNLDAKFIFAFEEGVIFQLAIQEDAIKLYTELGLTLCITHKKRARLFSAHALRIFSKTCCFNFTYLPQNSTNQLENIYEKLACNDKQYLLEVINAQQNLPQWHNLAHTILARGQHDKICSQGSRVSPNLLARKSVYRFFSRAAFRYIFI